MTPIDDATRTASGEPSPDSRPTWESAGTVVGPFTLLEHLGAGGFGDVYLAEQREPVARKVALKILKPGLDTREVIARFEQERTTLALMDHPHIARVLDAGATAQGRPFFVMELVDGQPVTAYCDAHGLSIRQRLELFAQVCRAVQHAHQKGILHRDIKPSNVLVSTHDERPHAKVIDFGVAKAIDPAGAQRTLFTEQGQFVGTPAYTSPEQAEGNPDIDTRADIYSLGVLLYELLTGTLPFDPRALRASGFAEMQRVIREVDPPRPSARISLSTDTLPAVARSRQVEPAKLPSLLRGELDWIVMKALEKDRARRYDTANGLALDVERYLMGEPVLAAPPSTSYRLRKFVHRHKGAVVAATAVLAVLLGGVVGTTIGLLEARRQARIAGAVNQFLTEDLLSAADPARAGGRQVTVREVVDRAASRVGTRFSDEPVVGATVERTLGDLYSRLGEFEPAQRHLDRAYALFDDHLGATDRATLEVRGSLDELRKLKGQHEQGIPAVEESIRVIEKKLGPDDRLTLAERTRLASMLSARAQYDRAEPILRDVWQRQERVLGAADRDTVGTVNELALLFMQQQKFDQAVPLQERALQELRGSLGPDDPDTLQVAMNLGWTYQELGDTPKAEAMTAEALTESRRVLGNDHPTTQLAVNNLGVIYNRSGRPERAEPLYREGLEASRRTLPPNHPDLVPALSNLAKLYSNMKKYDQAEPLFAEAVAKGRELFDAKDFRRGALLIAYGQFLLDTGRAKEAIPVLQEAEVAMAANVPPEHPGRKKLASLLAQATGSAP